ncbi:MAG: TolC family protein [Methylococcales bacterium]|nr:TolC family protein [Methylococcales bacterium]
MFDKNINIPKRFKFFSPLFTVSLLLNSVSLPATEKNVYNLSQAVDYALVNNPNLQIMGDRIAQAETQLGIALSSFYPNIKAGLFYEHSDNPSRAFGMIIAQRRLDFSPTTDFNHPGGTDNYRPEISAKYSLFRGGQDYFQSKAAQLGVDAAELEKKAARNYLIQTVSSTFYGYLAATEADKVTIKSLSAVENELKQSQNRYEAGSALRSDVLSLEVQLAEAKDKKIQTANAIELAKIGLKSLLGLNAQEPFEVDLSSQWTLPENNRSFDELLDVAKSQRPETKAANKKIEIAEQQLNATRGAYLPKADAYISYGSDSKNLNFSTNRDNVTAGVMVEVDIFSGFRDSEKIKKSEYQVAIAKKMAKQTQLNIESAVKRSHLKLVEALARVKVTSSSVTAANEAFRLVNEQRKAGTVTVTRYIEAEVARDKSLTRNIAARFDALRAEAELNQAIGHWK